MSMTRRSVTEQARQVYEQTVYPGVRNMLAAFSASCPTCESGRDRWRFDIDPCKRPPITEHGTFHVVRYRCECCGAVFRKVEEVGDDA